MNIPESFDLNRSSIRHFLQKQTGHDSFAREAAIQVILDDAVDKYEKIKEDTDIAPRLVHTFVPGALHTATKPAGFLPIAALKYDSSKSTNIDWSVEKIEAVSDIRISCISKSVIENKDIFYSGPNLHIILLDFADCTSPISKYNLGLLNKESETYKFNNVMSERFYNKVKKKGRSTLYSEEEVRLKNAIEAVVNYKDKHPTSVSEDDLRSLQEIISKSETYLTISSATPYGLHLYIDRPGVLRDDDVAKTLKSIATRYSMAKSATNGTLVFGRATSYMNATVLQWGETMIYDYRDHLSYREALVFDSRSQPFITYQAFLTNVTGEIFLSEIKYTSLFMELFSADFLN